MKRRLVLAFSHLAVLAGGYGIHRVMAPPEPVVIAARVALPEAEAPASAKRDERPARAERSTADAA